jgi:5'-nucleotidase
MFRRTTLLIAAWAALLLAGCATAPAPEQSEPLKVQVLAINDFHGHLLPPAPFRLQDPNDPSKTIQVPVGGSEALATAVKTLRANKPHHVFVAAGDLIGATPLLSALFFDEPTLESLTAMGLHMSAVGNHEFDNGWAELLRRQNGGCHPTQGCRGPAPFKGTGFQYLAASTIDTATGKTLLPPYQVRRFDGIPVGFIGLSLEGTPGLVMPTAVTGLRFDDEAESVNRWVKELQGQGIESIVVLIHEGGYPSTNNHNGCEGLSGPILDILQRMDKAVDLVVTGHTHRAYNCVIDGRRVTSGDRHGSMVTDIELQIDRRTRDVVSTQATNVLVRLDTFAKDPAQTELLAGYIAKAKPLTEREVGRLTADVPAAGREDDGNSPMGMLLADAQWIATRGDGAEIALMNTCGVRAGFSMASTKGVIRYADLFSAQPFNNVLITLSLSGQELLNLLQSQWRDARACNRLQASSSLRYTWDAARPVDQRVLPESITINGQALQLTRDYRITVNNFMAEGGDGFAELKRGRDRRTGPNDVDALEAYVQSVGEVRPPSNDRARRLN